MNTVKSIFHNYPIIIYSIISFTVLLIIAYKIITIIIKNKNFRNQLINICKDADETEIKSLKEMKPGKILGKSKLIEDIAKTVDIKIIDYTNIDILWINKLIKSFSKKYFHKLLEFAPEKGLFYCFLGALKKDKLTELFLQWINNSNDMLVMRKIALSGKGEEFDGQKAYAFFKKDLSRIREMTGDPEWLARYFAIKILIYDNDSKAERALWESFKDPNPLIRKTLIKEFSSDKRKKIYEKILDLYLNDPILDIRKTAKTRIMEDFHDLYTMNFENISEVQALHLIELFDKESDEDINIALKYLAEDNLELRLPSALFLSSCGKLGKLLIESSLDDKEAMKRNFDLLKKASEVNVTEFLMALENAETTGAVLIAAKLLQKSGNRSLITLLSNKVFSSEYYNSNMDIYKEIIKCISRRGDYRALIDLNNELKRNHRNKTKSDIILSYLPERGDFFFMDTLKGFLEDKDYPSKEKLKDSFLTFDSSLYIDKLFSILKYDSDKYHHEVKILALKILGGIKKDYCLQFLLENLHILPLDEAREFTKMLSDFVSDKFNIKAEMLLESTDSLLRARLISSLPETGKKIFVKNIKDSLKDPDPEVRISSIWALIDYNEAKALEDASEILRDPVERVRLEAARALGTAASTKGLGELKKLIADKNEVLEVKRAAVDGLKNSRAIVSIDILVDKLKDDELDEEICRALSCKKSEKEVERLTEKFKEATADVRDKIVTAFKLMKNDGEKKLYKLIESEVSLKKYIAEILESTGFVENRIRQLNNRNIKTRQSAAKFLSTIDRTSAYRGIVLAARDPDQDVRVIVTKAMEKLNTEAGKNILEDLEKDPDKRIRKYTFWALERMKAKGKL